MKKAKKVVALALCAVMLVVGSVAGTMAYLTSTDEVTNTFTVGNVVITLDETNVDEDVIKNDKGEDVIPDRDKTNDYHLMPGHEYTKDPIIHVTSDSEDCYVFVKVTNNIKAIEDATTNVAAQMAENGWTCIDETNGVYVYGDATAPTKVAKAAEDKNIEVFEQIKIAGTIDNETLADYAGETIEVVAYAVQADGFEGKTAEYIWGTAF